MAQRGNIAKQRMLEDRGALPKEDGDQVRQYKALHEDNFLGHWLRVDMEVKTEEVEYEEEDHKSINKRWEKGDRGRKGEDRGGS